MSDSDDLLHVEPCAARPQSDHGSADRVHADNDDMPDREGRRQGRQIDGLSGREEDYHDEARQLSDSALGAHYSRLLLRARGVRVVEPVTGFAYFGPVGSGHDKFVGARHDKFLGTPRAKRYCVVVQDIACGHRYSTRGLPSD